MAYAKLIAFDRMLSGAVVPGRSGRTYGEAEVAQQAEAAYRRGVDATRAAADQQMVELRHEMEQLSTNILTQLAEVEPRLMAQLREALPSLAVEIGRRLLAGFEPPAEVVDRLCSEALEHLYPERDGLELSLCPRDAELLTGLNPDWLRRYPNLRIMPDPSLRAGDCQVRSRFGLTDARRETKVAALEHHLTGT
ncbi:MAG TPA: FliH/SctL family protein [Candidatus Didemnitutus sp.]|nr:FliH/SctL family protein [Candidatus Didemnitutus sp.]